MQETMDIQQYLTEGVEAIVRDALRATLRDPKESLFMARFAAASRKASERRAKNEKEGLHVPSYLIASITSACNLHCAGCYSRANHATEDCAPQRQLTTEQWESIFTQAGELGVSFILLAGGEPLLRSDVITAAGKHPGILFPIFTNGTYLNDKYFQLLDRCRNLIPVISIEGDQTLTDARRGEGIYGKVTANMERLQKQGLLFGCSITVTTENLDEVLSDEFVASLSARGCKALFYIEFVPVTDEARHLAPGDAERERIRAGIERLRAEHPDTVFVSFPGDEKSSGGCLAAGRGFFHINSHGGAEPCPFSPYSDINVAETSLKDALNSGLFHALRDNGHLLEDHVGGCVLYEKRALVEELLQERKEKNHV
jgi:MoaA/NifB/PqqE/SkfB family radical SAM enzyme